ncbi:chromate efflux transporter [Shewanella morhuae]|uniref:Chromate transporter, chromate ion transporter (CHR) family n=1 Tax=Shewanella morhuae TaxID=365591 RepID=A0A380AEE6_9GAMM|nr:chromate efflux transporter [Shewanella morhuae]GIU13701.1 chromate efflux pump [Shewanella morhuae]SUI78668.1 chromate transporter, chromate ion transporter (CHR) family [Shewanella morhuae]
MLQIFLRFFTLGLMSFGGPAAHIGYFRHTFVNELGWLDDKRYASLVALSQFIPGPGSSQVGFAIGYHRGGLAGALAAFIGFTLPSFVLMYLLAVTTAAWLANHYVQGMIYGLKLMAVVVVADAVLAMFTQFCQRQSARLLMLVSAAAMLMAPFMWTQMALLLVAATVGIYTLSAMQDDVTPLAPIRLNYVYLLLFLVLLIGSFFTVQLGPETSIFGEFYRVGSLVFGGGHVVLPLLETAVGDTLSGDRFLTGYAFAQAVPGPMFTFASFLGAEMLLDSPLKGAAIATAAIFLPGFLLMLVALKSWHAIAARPKIAGAIAGVNACVVGLLAAALYQPVFSQAVFSAKDMALVLLGFGVLKLFRPSMLLLVVGFSLSGMLLHSL